MSKRNKNIRHKNNSNNIMTSLILTLLCLVNIFYDEIIVLRELLIAKFSQSLYKHMHFFEKLNIFQMTLKSFWYQISVFGGFLILFFVLSFSFCFLFRFYLFVFFKFHFLVFSPIFTYS